MFKSRFIKFGLTTLLLCSTAQAGFAAAPQTPAGAWTVGPISAKAENGAGFCSMKNNYPGGKSLVFARDNTGSNSIALDFHKDAFQEGDQYSVKAVSGSVIRNLDALAATKQVLVIQTGIDTVLYGELARKHKVTFTIKKSSYTYELDVSAADALVALGHCSESFASGMAFAPATFPLGTVHPESLKQMSEAGEQPADEGADTDQQPAPEKPHKKTRHSHAAKEPVTEQQIDLQVTEAEAAPERVDTVRDDVKTEIAEELLNLHGTGSTAGHLSKSASATTASAPLAAVDQSPLPGVHTAMAPVIMPHVESLDLKNLLLSSHVVSAQEITTGTNANVIRWTSGGLFGSAQQLTQAPGKSLTDVATAYLHKTASLCKGDFAQKLGQPRTAGNFNVLEADITCLDGQNNAAAAVLFIGKQNTFGIITEEGTIDQLHTAMANRDALIAAAGGHTRASNDIRPLALHDTHVLAAAPPVHQNADAPAKLVEEINAVPPSPPSSYSSASVDPDPSSPPPQNPSPKQPALATHHGLDAGVDVSRYKYREDNSSADPFINQSGYKGAVDLAYTMPVPMISWLPNSWAYWPDWYLRGEGRLAAGTVNYSSAGGTQSGQTDNLWEIRGLVGKDFIYDNYALSPYTGYGFRFLYNKINSMVVGGTLSGGYRRQINYQYIPIGLTTRFGLQNQSDTAANSDIAANIEYDFFTAGSVKSYLADAGVFPDASNHQRNGEGLRGSLMFEMGGWSVGPWFDWWHIGASDSVTVTSGSTAAVVDEPANKTTEIGFRIMKQVW